VVSGATAWYGLRAYNAAYATGSNNAINVRRASDNTTSNIVILSNGNLDIATANTFAGVDATASATTTGSSTTIALTSASSTPHVGSTITGVGITQPCYIVSVGTFTAGAGTITVNQAQTISVAESISMQYGLYVTEAYDQTGNGNNASQATAGNQPQLLPSGGIKSSLPCLSFANNGALITGVMTSVAQPWSMSAVAERITRATTINGILMGTAGQAFFSATSGFVQMYAGSVAGPAASENSPHAMQFIANGASGTVNVDGTSTTENPGTNGTGTALGIGGNTSNGQLLSGYIGETGLWPSGFNSTQISSMHANQSAYWGTP
jgi:hypothetical protein